MNQCDELFKKSDLHPVGFYLALLSACLIYVALKSWFLKGGRKAASCLSWLLRSESWRRYLCSREITPPMKGGDHLQVETFLTVRRTTHVLTAGR